MFKRIWGAISTFVFLIAFSLGNILVSNVPQNFGIVRTTIAEIYDKIGVLDFIANGKYSVNGIKSKFPFDGELNGKASLVYFKAVGSRDYACQLAHDAINVQCEANPNFWEEVRSRTSIESNIAAISGLHAASLQMKDIPISSGILADEVKLRGKN